MNFFPRTCLLPLAFLFATCSPHSSESATPVLNSQNNQIAEAGNIRLFRLDTKTSIPFADRDRTDQQYFHGFRILSETALKGGDAQQRIAELLANIRKGVWTHDQIRDADYGISLQSEDGIEDLLLCTHCAPPVVARPADASESVLLAETSASLVRIMLLAFGDENPR